MKILLAATVFFSALSSLSAKAAVIDCMLSGSPSAKLTITITNFNINEKVKVRFQDGSDTEEFEATQSFVSSQIGYTNHKRGFSAKLTTGPSNGYGDGGELAWGSLLFVSPNFGLYEGNLSCGYYR